MKIAVVDIETTGFQEQGGLIIEIAIVGLDLNTGEIVCEFDSVVKDKKFGIKHTKNPYGWIFQNSDLTYDDVNSAVSIDDVLPEIQLALDKYKLGAAAFNKSFDFGFLRQYGIKVKDLPCIMKVATPVVNLPPKKGSTTPKWPRVYEAWRFLYPDIEYEEQHRAYDDAVHEAKILYKLFKLGKYKPFLKDE